MKNTAESPIWLHKKSGHWCKTIKGHRHHFGRDHDAALAEWYRCKDDLEAGRPKPPKSGAVWTIADACNYCLTRKKAKREAGELSHRQYDDLKTMSIYLIDHFGRNRSVDSLVPDDFGELRAKMAKRWSVGSLTTRIRNIRHIFKFSYENMKIEKQVRYGDQFSTPTARQKRLHKSKQPAKFIQADDIKLLLEHASPHLRAFILLAANAGMGNTDISELRVDDIDLDGEPCWLDLRRHKTGIFQRAQLWQVTVAAIKEARADQPTSQAEEKRDLMFLTRHRNQWSNPKTCDCAISKQFGKLAKLLGIKGTFYSLRHVVQTIGDQVKDPVAVKVVMGHADPSISAQYREGTLDANLVAVTDHIRNWLFTEKD